MNFDRPSEEALVIGFDLGAVNRDRCPNFGLSFNNKEVTKLTNWSDIKAGRIEVANCEA